MLGIPISGPSYIYIDNISVIYNSSRPESVLRKKSNSVCYHAVHESVAMGEFLVEHMPSKKNIADFLTKVLHGQRGDTWPVISFMIFTTTIRHQ